MAEARRSSCFGVFFGTPTIPIAGYRGWEWNLDLRKWVLEKWGYRPFQTVDRQKRPLEFVRDLPLIEPDDHGDSIRKDPTPETCAYQAAYSMRRRSTALTNDGELIAASPGRVRRLKNIEQALPYREQTETARGD